MTRNSFFKSIGILLASPKIIIEISKNISLEKEVKNETGNLFEDLNMLTSHYYKSYLEKYGDKSYTEFLNHNAWNL